MLTHGPVPTWTPLERRTPGETDVRIFTTELLPRGRHRLDRTRPMVRRVHHDEASGRASLRLVFLAVAGTLLAVHSLRS